MNSLIQVILDLIRRLLGGQSQKLAEASGFVLPDTDLPPDQPLDDVPLIMSSLEAEFAAINETETGQVPLIEDMARGGSCKVTIRPELGVVNIRLGPRLEFTVLAKTQGGAVFDLVGGSEADPDGHRWFALRVGPQSGWVRSDLVTLSEECLELGFITRVDLNRPGTESPGERFPLPLTTPISQGYHSGHRALDITAPTGRELRAATVGIVIRRVDCVACTDARPNVFPAPGLGCPGIYKDPDWGFGYGNFLVVRHAYDQMPPAFRATMDQQGLTGGFAYLLYAHLSRLDVDLGDVVSAGTLLGLSGNHGCSSGPHLHLEIRMGRDEIIDGRWGQQAVVNPNLLFTV